MDTKDFHYDLPESLIAQTPLKDRTHSRLMVVDRKLHKINHHYFSELGNFLKQGDLLLLNDTKVSPVRIFGHRLGKEESVEMLLLKELEPDRWQVLVKPGKKARPGDVLNFNQRLLGHVEEMDEEGNRIVRLEYDGNLYEILDEIGYMPLPPYIHEKLEEKDRYQTVYAKLRGSAAAPTAGLHFTEEMLGHLKDQGVNIAFLTLHIGLGTFRPVKVDRVEEHKMHTEFYMISEETVEAIKQTKAQGGRVICVGTTSVRALESAFSKAEGLVSGSGWTDIFIYPGYEFHCVDGMITNFHLPESTLLMLVSAFADKDFILEAYREAVKQQYRFFSFGDCMLII